MHVVRKGAGPETKWRFLLIRLARDLTRRIDSIRLLVEASRNSPTMASATAKQSLGYCYYTFILYSGH